MADVRGEPVLGLRERKKRRTRATLIDAAVGLCDSQGFDDTTVDQIAAIADVSPRTFSRYFSTKDAIALALIDEVLDKVAAELERQPADLGHLEAMRRAYREMAEKAKLAQADALSSTRLMQILRIVISSGPLRQAALEYRANSVDAAMARRLGTTVDDRRVKLLCAVWGAVVMTALRELAEDSGTMPGIGIDAVIAAVDATYADFTGEIAGLGQPV